MSHFNSIGPCRTADDGLITVPRQQVPLLKLFAPIIHDEWFVQDKQQHYLELSPVRVKPENGTQLVLPEAGVNFGREIFLCRAAYRFDSRTRSS
jgi:hypothetical protein